MMTEQTWTLLRKHYPENEYALMSEVSDMAGFYRSRSADYVAVNLWPSRGLSVIGFEEKKSRSDWLAELKKPEKAENIFQYCDYWYLITHGDTIAKIEEIPESWGWKAMINGKIKTIKEAPKLTPKPISRHFMAAMIKRGSDRNGWVRVDSIQDKIKEAIEQQRSYDKQQLERATKELQALRKEIYDFEAESGIRINQRWHDMKKLGASVKFVMDGGIDSQAKRLEMLEQTAAGILKDIQSQLSRIEK